MTNSTLKINNEVEIAFRDWTADTVKTDIAKIKRVDIFKGAGWTSAHFISPRSEGSAATEESWAFAKAAINSGFPKAAQAMMEMSAKACGDRTVNGQSRFYWTKQANAVLADIKKQLKHREDVQAEIASGKSGADTRTVSVETKVRELLNDAIKRIQKADEFDCSIDLDDLTTGLANLAKTIG